MTEYSKFQSIDSIDLYGDGIGKVTLYDASHANESEDQRIWTVTTIASLAYGNESAKDPEALYKRMKSIKHESLWEFIRFGDFGMPYYDFSTIDGSMRNNIDDCYTTGESQYSTKDHITMHSQNIACFRIKVPLFVRAQFMRHRSFSYLEMSRRYTKAGKVPFELWFPSTLTAEDRTMLQSHLLEPLQWMTEAGYDAQITSRFLPQTTYTEFYMMGEIEGLRNFFKLRCDSHAQAEIREVANAMLKLIEIHQSNLFVNVVPIEGVSDEVI